MNQIESLKLRWQSLPSRDQMALKLMLLILVPAILYAGVIVPIQNHSQEAESLLTKRLELNQWLQRFGPEAKAKARSSGKTTSGNTNLSSTVNRVARSSGITIQRFENDRKGGLRVWLESVSFDQFAGMLISLEQKHGITAEQLTIEKEKTPGTVSVRGVLVAQ